jgi:hypothetical protein
VLVAALLDRHRIGGNAVWSTMHRSAVERLDPITVKGDLTEFIVE